MNQLLLGAIAMASFTAGIFFLRFWRNTKDRFFLFFAVAFLIEAANRVGLSLTPINPLPEDLPVFYIVRVIVFGLIITAIADKNWPKKNA